MAVGEVTSCVLLIILLIAPAASCAPVFGDERPAGLPADLTARVDELFARWNHWDSLGCAECNRVLVSADQTQWRPVPRLSSAA